MLNFLDYVNARFYDGTASTLKTTRAPIALEIVPGLNHTAGAIAIARGSAPDSATSQWFHNLADNAVFGRFTTGAALLGAGGAIAAAPHVQVSWLPADGSCLPTLNLVVTSATQVR